jgi:succinate dehydrogenase/fumarate reductase flavoprotein subunit
MIETDVAIIGSGAAGLTAAIVARHLGLEVLVIEKTSHFGGTTAYSGGAPWIPGNSYMRGAGVEDSREETLTYLRSVLGEKFVPALMEAYVDNAPRMMDFMEANSAVRFKLFLCPDYESHQPGAKRCRTLLTQAYPGHLLGERLAELRLPLSQLMLFGSMQVEGTDVHPLRNTFRTWAGFKHTTKLFMRFLVERALHGRGTTLKNGNALAARLFHSAILAGVTLWRNTPALELIKENGAVTGVIVEKDGRRVEVRARRGVLLATGGYGANATMRARYIPLAEHHHSMQPEGNVGDGVRMGVHAGGFHDPAHAGDCIWAPISILHQPDGSFVKYPHIFIDRSMPGCIAVGPDGKRFVNEGTSYQNFVSTMQRRGISRAHLVADREFLRKYGLGLARPAPFSERKYKEAGYLIEASSIEELGAKIKVDPQVLAATVKRFNEPAARGEDPEFGKGADVHSRFRGDQTHQPNTGVAPIGVGPYYAVAIFPGDLSTVGGLATNERSQVLDASGAPVAGLYAAGLDMNSIMRGGYPSGGSSIGPAMTFGYIAARQMAKQPMAHSEVRAAVAA